MKAGTFFRLVSLLLLALWGQSLSNKELTMEIDNAESLSDVLSPRIKRDVVSENRARLLAERKVLELYIICDKRCYEKVAKKYEDPAAYFYEMVLIADMKLQNTSSQLLLVGLEFWNIEDRVDTTGNLTTLQFWSERFRRGTQVNRIWSDFTVLFTVFLHKESKLAQFNWGWGCDPSGSAGVISTSHDSAGRVAAVLVHELIHGIGSDHDKKGCCKYGDGNCVMNTYLNSFNTRNSFYSECTVDDVVRWLDMDYRKSACLYDEPQKVFVPEGLENSCGNGVVEEGEDCDCGQGCLFGCCECCENCTFKAGAECAKGDCCNVTTCQLLGEETICKEAKHDFCDSDHVCNGESPDCPSEYRNEGANCSDDFGENGYCRKGRCLTRSQQCKDIYDSDPDKVYREASERCYNRSVNEAATSKFNCGKRNARRYRKCSTGSQYHYMCGLLQCTGPTVSRPSKETVMYRYPAGTELDTGEYCVKSYELYWEKPPGDNVMVEDGAPCMEDGACYRGNCLNKTIVFELLHEENLQPQRRGYCGDGIVNPENGEECDCGPLQCECCDISTCKFRKREISCQGNACRFCDGQSTNCTGGDFTDFRYCENNEGRCYQGQCSTLKKKCQQIYGSHAVPSSPNVYRNNVGYNRTKHNAGGYFLARPGSTSEVHQKFVSAQDNNGTCGLLLCDRKGVSTPDATIRSNLGLNSDVKMSTQYSWTNFPNNTALYVSTDFVTIVEEGETYDKYLPILTPNGVPCTIGRDSKPGYCSHEFLAMPDGAFTWYWYSTCVEL